MPKYSALERFEAKFALDSVTGCWLWTACRTGGGYGQFSGTHRRCVPAHVWSYEHYVGPIPRGLVLDHLCRVRHCVNPMHLEPVSVGENLLRGETRAAANAAKTHCQNGHPLTGDNLYLKPGHREGHFQRICRECKNTQNRRDLRNRAVRLGSWRTPEQRAKDTIAARRRRAEKKRAATGLPIAAL